MIALVLGLVWGAGPGSARATAVYDYQPDEYVTIRDGAAPDGRHALATHGAGELGAEDFHVWLMQDGKPVAALPDIGAANNLDTAAAAYNAFWSPDSRHVGISWRVSRHLMSLNLYAIDGARVTPVALPDLFAEVAGRKLAAADDVRTAVPLLEWRDGSRLVVKDYRLFVTDKAGAPALLRALGRFGRRDGEQPRLNQIFVQFAAEAVLALRPTRRARLVDLKPGDLAWWRSRIRDPR